MLDPIIFSWLLWKILKIRGQFISYPMFNTILIIFLYRLPKFLSAVQQHLHLNIYHPIRDVVLYWLNSAQRNWMMLMVLCITKLNQDQKILSIVNIDVLAVILLEEEQMLYLK